MEKKIYQEPTAKVVELSDRIMDALPNGSGGSGGDETSKSANDYVPFDEDEDDYTRRR